MPAASTGPADGPSVARRSRPRRPAAPSPLGLAVTLGGRRAPPAAGAHARRIACAARRAAATAPRPPSGTTPDEGDADPRLPAERRPRARSTRRSARGSYRAHGIDLTVQAPTSTSDTLKLMAAGKADFGIVSLLDFLTAYQPGPADQDLPGARAGSAGGHRLVHQERDHLAEAARGQARRRHRRAERPRRPRLDGALRRR